MFSGSWSREACFTEIVLSFIMECFAGLENVEARCIRLSVLGDTVPVECECPARTVFCLMSAGFST